MAMKLSQLGGKWRRRRLRRIRPTPPDCLNQLYFDFMIAPDQKRARAAHPFAAASMFDAPRRRLAA